MIGHRLMGLSLLHTGDIAEGRAHLDRAIALYDPAEHRPLATRFGQDVGAASLSWKSMASWLLGYPRGRARRRRARAQGCARDRPLRDVDVRAEFQHLVTHIHCGNYAAANALIDEFIALTDQTGSLFWGAWGMMQRGCVLALTGKASDAVQTITSGVTAMRSTGTTMWMPLWLIISGKSQAEHRINLMTPGAALARR